MNLEQANKAMENDFPVFYKGHKRYILFMNTLNGTCDLIKHKLDYKGPNMPDFKNVKIKDLQEQQMFIGDFVIYQGAIHKITSTFNDGTVDLDFLINVDRDEVDKL